MYAKWIKFHYNQKTRFKINICIEEIIVIKTRHLCAPALIEFSSESQDINKITKNSIVHLFQNENNRQKNYRNVIKVYTKREQKPLTHTQNTELKRRRKQALLYSSQNI